MNTDKELITHLAALIALCVAGAGCRSSASAPTPALTWTPPSPVTVIPIVIVPSPEPTVTFTPSPPATFTLQPSRASTPTRAVTKPAPVATLAPPIWDGRLDDLNIRLIPAAVNPGQAYWRLIKAKFRDEKESQDTRYIFISVLDESGNRIIGQRIVVEWIPNERAIIITEDKPASEYSANFMMDGSHVPPYSTLGAYLVSIDGLPSDKLMGMGLPPKNRFVAYLLTFQRAVR